MPPKPSARESSYLRTLLILVLTVGILYFAKTFLVPLALTILLAFILAPIVAWLQGRGLGRIPAVVATVGLAFVVFGVVAWIVGAEIVQLARELPDHETKIRERIADLRGSGGGTFSNLFRLITDLDAEPQKAAGVIEGDEKPKPIVVAAPAQSSWERLASTVPPVLEPLATGGLIVCLVIYVLIKREDLRNRMIGLLGHGRLTSTTRVLVDAAHRVSRYLLTQLLINVAFGSLFGVGLFFIGVRYAFLWGFLTALLRFIPYIGTWISAVFPFLLSFALSDSLTQPILVFCYFLLLDAVTGNIVEPLLFGKHTGVSPVALLTAAAFWTWVWGPLGLVLSTPLTVCLVVLGQHIPRLKFLTLLLGDQPALEPHESYFQRLLARDEKEAEQIVVEYAKTQGPEKACDDVLLAALVLTRRDRKQGGLIAEDEAFILQATRDILARMAAPPAAAPGDSPPAALLIVGCPAHTEAEELSLEMLALLMKPDGCRVDALTTKALPAEIEARVAAEAPSIVFIAAMPPGGLVQARYLCKRLSKRFADLPLIIGYWGDERNFDRLLVRLRSAGASYVTTSLAQSRSQIRALLGAASAPSPLLSPAGAD